MLLLRLQLRAFGELASGPPLSVHLRTGPAEVCEVVVRTAGVGAPFPPLTS
ncbi:hypothetical protein [Amycolatopsis sp. cmx-4-83]|uniref:hypothetical protein n=1 Tax=Amycolatopsis sp. cmx-4-83 TaxID=2790940 RepID=UPI003978FB38